MVADARHDDQTGFAPLGLIHWRPMLEIGRMNRREILCSSLALAGTRWLRAAGPTVCAHLVAKVDDPGAIPMPGARRASFGWQSAAIGAEPLRLTWPDLPADAQVTRLRIAAALDERDVKRIDAFALKTGAPLGTIEVRFASQFQLYELPITRNQAADGVGLKLAEGAPMRVFTHGDTLPPALAVHLLVPGQASPEAEFLRRLDSLACVQQFGWMEGCVVDGLLDLAAIPRYAHLRAAAQRHLDLFVNGGQLTYDGPRCEIISNRIYGIEGPLPLAALAQLAPSSPVLDLLPAFCAARQDADGAVLDGRSASSEGAYTVGYPLAVLARVRGDDALAKAALAQLGTRQARLFVDGQFYRTHNADGGRGDRNWARGMAWQMLGYARVLRELRDRTDLAPLIGDLRALATHVRRLQRPDGLWSVFADDQTLTPDTGGSAGIAAALAIGARQGWLGAEDRAAAQRCQHALLTRLTPDGFLSGVSQSNKGGGALQRSDYRVIYQMGMGLLAQLMAALAE